jgi:carbonic anhydrase/acetyltransferase-like protein (isoleucine patch superfamily)
MSLYKYKGVSPKLGKNVFIAPGAHVIGRVVIGDDVGIWFNSVLRGDVANIQIGSRSNVQDGSILHMTDNIDLIIGESVTIGHNAIIHSSRISDFCLIGMGSLIMDNVVVGKESLVAAGAVLPPGKVYGERKLIRGNPAVEVRDLKPEEVAALHESAEHYVNRKNEYLDQLIVEKI